MANKIKGFIGETLIYGVANVFSRVFAMLLIPLYASYLGKIDYANLVLLQVTFSMLTFVLGLNSGVFYYYYEYENLKYRKKVFSSWFYYELVIASVITLGLYVLSPIFSHLFLTDEKGFDTLRVCIPLLGVQLFPYLINNTTINLYRIDRSPKNVLLITALEALFTLSFIGLGLAFFQFGLIEIILAQIIARSLVALIYIKKATFYMRFKAFSTKMLKRLFRYSWPFFAISIFQYFIISIDKFIGADLLSNKDDVALLAITMQLALPITVLSDMIRMAIGPFVMSIRKDERSEKHYQQIFELSIFAGILVLIAIVAASPFLILFLSDATYLYAMEILPLIAFASVLSLFVTQFSISFSLVKKTIFILYAAMIGGAIAMVINYFLMPIYGIYTTGYAQIASYLAMAVFLYYSGKQKANLKLHIGPVLFLFVPTVLYLSYVYYNMESIIRQPIRYDLILFGSITFLLAAILYLRSINFILKSSS